MTGGDFGLNTNVLDLMKSYNAELRLRKVMWTVRIAIRWRKVGLAREKAKAQELLAVNGSASKPTTPVQLKAAENTKEVTKKIASVSISTHSSTTSKSTSKTSPSGETSSKKSTTTQSSVSNASTGKSSSDGRRRSFEAPQPLPVSNSNAKKTVAASNVGSKIDTGKKTAAVPSKVGAKSK